jgi:hypothetical protein
MMLALLALSGVLPTGHHPPYARKSEKVPRPQGSLFGRHHIREIKCIPAEMR